MQRVSPVRPPSASAEARKRAVAAAYDPNLRFDPADELLLKAFLPAAREQQEDGAAAAAARPPRDGRGSSPQKRAFPLMGVLHAGGSMLLSTAISIGTLGRLRGGSGGPGRQAQDSAAAAAAANAAAANAAAAAPPPNDDALASLRAAAKRAALAGATVHNGTRNRRGVGSSISGDKTTASPPSSAKQSTNAPARLLELEARAFASPPALEPPLAPAELRGRRLVVCVTGATGYVAGHIVHRLLAAGHTVRGTCRAPDDDGAVEHLWRLPGAAERLSLHKADLLAPHGAFDAAVAGSDVVVHSASPYVVQGYKRGQEDARIVRPAVHGTESVLGSVERAPGVRRVVLTASTASVFTDPVADVGRRGSDILGLGLGEEGGGGIGGGAGGGGGGGGGFVVVGKGDARGSNGDKNNGDSGGSKADALLAALGLAAATVDADADASAVLRLFGLRKSATALGAAQAEAEGRQRDAGADADNDRGGRLHHHSRPPGVGARHAPPPRAVATERDWNVGAGKASLPYFYAKTAAERRAYELEAAQASLRPPGGGGGEKRWSLASINPPAVLGPPLSSRADGESVSQMRGLLSGRLWPCGSPYVGVGACDVRDVAQAHALAAVLPGAPRGRFLVASVCEGYALHEAALLLRRLYPRRWVPRSAVESRPLALPFCPMLGLPRAMARAMWAKPVALSTRRARELLGKGAAPPAGQGGGGQGDGGLAGGGGLPYLPFEKTVADMAEAMIARGMVPDERPVLVVFAAKGAALAAALLLALALAARLGLSFWRERYF